MYLCAVVKRTKTPEQVGPVGCGFEIAAHLVSGTQHYAGVAFVSLLVAGCHAAPAINDVG